MTSDSRSGGTFGRSISANKNAKKPAKRRKKRSQPLQACVKMRAIYAEDGG
jgi:hypothetical protein